MLRRAIPTMLSRFGLRALLLEAVSPSFSRALVPNRGPLVSKQHALLFISGKRGFASSSQSGREKGQRDFTYEAVVVKGREEDEEAEREGKPAEDDEDDDDDIDDDVDIYVGDDDIDDEEDDDMDEDDEEEEPSNTELSDDIAEVKEEVQALNERLDEIDEKLDRMHRALRIISNKLGGRDGPRDRDRS